MKISKHGNIYELTSIQKLPISLDKAWNFLSSPANLKEITPDYMGFDIVSGYTGAMYPGQIIQYIVKPLLGIKTRWVSEITYVSDKSYFVDEQRFGPYDLWHHKHFLKEVEGGVEMHDTIHYKLPFSPIANLFHGLLVKPRLEEIFTYRESKLVELFGEFKEETK
jgi:ligand-binding SRPBCC domain-containing protein